MSGFFDTSGFPARWHCGDWSSWVGWLTIGSDLAIFTAYTAIPLTIIWYMRKRGDVPFPVVLWLFSAFIFACGATHLFEVVIFWHPIYPQQAVLKLFTAAVSIATVIAIARLMPQALAIPGMAAINQRLHSEITARTASQEELERRSADLQHSEARLLAAQQAAGIGDWSFEPASERIFWSDEVFRLFERDQAAGPPKNLAENMALYTTAGAEQLSAMLARIHGGADRVAGTLEVRLPSGGVAWHQALLHAQRAPDGTLTRLWGTTQDITEQKRDELAKDQQRRELNRINQQLEQFAYIASHDLQEPLRKMRFFTDVVRDESHGKLTPDGEDALRRLSAASERMTHLVKDLLGFARAGKSLVEVKRVALGKVLREALDNCDTLVRETGAVITVGDLPEVPGDHQLLVQVFQNLLANSMRYRHPDRAPQITITADISADVSDQQVTVRDNGLGFSSDQAGRLFEPFVRLHPQVDSSGTGIGLAICRRIIEAHGGSIAAAPRPEGGAEFTVRLPRMKDSDHVK